MTTCPTCLGPVIKCAKGRTRIYCRNLCKWTARRRREGRLTKEDYVRKGMKANPSVKQEWGSELRGWFLDKLLRNGWVHFQTVKRFGSELYQKNGYRIELDCNGLFLWTLHVSMLMFGSGWERSHGLSSDDVDRIKDDCLLFVEPGVMRWRRFDLQTGVWL